MTKIPRKEIGNGKPLARVWVDSFGTASNPNIIIQKWPWKGKAATIIRKDLDRGDYFVKLHNGDITILNEEDFLYA